jgi:hypothetical protein
MNYKRAILCSESLPFVHIASTFVVFFEIAMRSALNYAMTVAGAR